MKKYLLILINIPIFLNALDIAVYCTRTNVITTPNDGYCYERSTHTDSVKVYEKNEFHNYYVVFESDNYSWQDEKVYSDMCTESDGTVTKKNLVYTFTKKPCSNVNQEKDKDGNDVIYKDGIPYDKSQVENSQYYDNFNDKEVCNHEYLTVNGLCVKPDYEKRNMADVVIKSDNIVANDSTLTSYEIVPSSVKYKNNDSEQGIESVQVNFKSNDGSLTSSLVTFGSNDPIYSVNEDGSYSQTTPSYDSDSADISIINGSLNTIAHYTNNIKNDVGSIRRYIDYGNGILNKINDNVDILNAPYVKNPIERSEDVFDIFQEKISTFLTKFENSFLELRSIYNEKIEYFKSKDFSSYNSHPLATTCASNFSFNLDYRTNYNFVIDVCSVLNNIKMPFKNMSALEFFNTIFYIFFYFIILLSILKFAIFTVRII